jgi:hypothetical protein
VAPPVGCKVAGDLGFHEQQLHPKTARWSLDGGGWIGVWLAAWREDGWSTTVGGDWNWVRSDNYPGTPVNFQMEVNLYVFFTRLRVVRSFGSAKYFGLPPDCAPSCLGAWDFCLW